MVIDSKVRLVAPSSHASVTEGFNATLMGVTLADLIQMKCLSGASECVRVLSSGRIGVLQFSKGQLTHAVANDLLGEKAVLELLNWKTGDCEPFSMSLPQGSSIHRSWQSLLLASAEAIDEAACLPQAGLSRDKPHLDPAAGPPTSPPDGAVSVRMTMEGQVLEMVGPAEDLASVTAYALHMASHIGERLGLDALRGCAFRGGELRTVLFMESDDEVRAVQSNAEADVAQARARAGL